MGNILAIDFDGVIHNKQDRVRGQKMGKPIMCTQEFMRKLRVAGYILIIHTLWASNPKSKQACEDWLRYFDIPFDEVTDKKPNADYYIDDHALLFTNWESVYHKITRIGENDEFSRPTQSN